jgi:2'-5' RNA ligase
VSTVALPGPLHGVVSLLDPSATTRVKSIWSNLEKQFGLRGVLGIPYPHFSYQVARNYDYAALEATLDLLSRKVQPFTIRTTGLETFDGNWPVVFIAVERDDSLLALHRRVWTRCLPHASDVISYYRPGAWVPHITLAYGEERNSVPLLEAQVQGVLQKLNTDTYRWEIPIDNIAIVWGDSSVKNQVRTFPLQGR